eukprot:scaffold100972_cov67-Phaeocystis_antarctica.AAC.4
MHFGLIVVAVWVLLTALWYILPTARADVYDLLLARTTEKWYAATLASGTPRRMARRKWHTAHGRVVVCHATALLPLQPDSRLLDVGIGTATALSASVPASVPLWCATRSSSSPHPEPKPQPQPKPNPDPDPKPAPAPNQVRNEELVTSRGLTVIGIDPEREYVTKATRVVVAAGLSDAVKVHCLSIYQPQPLVLALALAPIPSSASALASASAPASTPAPRPSPSLHPGPNLRQVHCLSIYQPGLRSAFAGKAKFDAAYFSGSLTVLPDPPAALRCAATMLKPGGKLWQGLRHADVSEPAGATHGNAEAAAAALHERRLRARHL